MKKLCKYILATAIYVGFIWMIQDAGEEVGSTVGELVADGIEEIPEELSGVKVFTKKAILKEKLFLKKIFDRIKKFHSSDEENIVLDKDDEETLKDIEKEVSEL